MSQVTLQGNASGTGVFTVAAPNSNTSRTLTLPDATGTVVTTDATQTLTNKSISGEQINSGTVAAARLGSGTPGTGNFLRGDGSWQSISVPSTNFEGVGSYAVAHYTASPGFTSAGKSSFLARGTTVAGSNLRVNSRSSENNVNISDPPLEAASQGPFNLFQRNAGDNTFITTNTITLTGTWRLMSAGAFAFSIDISGYGNWGRTAWFGMLWVRIS